METRFYPRKLLLNSCFQELLMQQIVYVNIWTKAFAIIKIEYRVRKVLNNIRTVINYFGRYSFKIS